MKTNSLRTALAFSLFTLLFTAAANFAQEIETPDENVLPPMISIPSDELTKLQAEKELKSRTSLCLQFADARLKRAELHTNGEDFEAALTELGSYQGLMEHSLKFLESQKTNLGKMRDNMRKLEIALRAHAPRIESLRRVTPSEYGFYIRKVQEFTRDARTRALDSFFERSTLVKNTETDKGNASPAAVNSPTKIASPDSEKKP